jgi:hypothetical protein
VNPPLRVTVTPAPAPNYAYWAGIAGFVLGMVMLVAMIALAWRSVNIDDIRAHVEKNTRDTRKVQQQVDQIESLYR